MNQQLWNQYLENNSLEFFGSNNLVEVQGVTLPASFTVEFQLKPKRYNDEYRYGLVDRRTGSEGWNIGLAGRKVANVGKIELRNGASEVCSSLSLMPINKWTHVVVAMSPSQVQIFINGKLETSNSGTWKNDNTKSIYFGGIGMYPVMYGFEGFMKEIRIYDRLLTKDEVRANYEGNVSRSGLLTEHLLTTDNGTASVDTSGNGLHGTISNAAYSIVTNVLTKQDKEVKSLRSLGYTGYLNDMRRAYYQSLTGIPFLTDAKRKLTTMKTVNVLKDFIGKVNGDGDATRTINFGTNANPYTSPTQFVNAVGAGYANVATKNGVPLYYETSAQQYVAFLFRFNVGTKADVLKYARSIEFNVNTKQAHVFVWNVAKNQFVKINFASTNFTDLSNDVVGIIDDCTDTNGDIRFLVQTDTKGDGVSAKRLEIDYAELKVEFFK